MASSGSIFWHTDKGLIKSADRGKTWKLLDAVSANPIELPASGYTPIAPATLLSAKGKQLYTSTDDGATWTAFKDPAPGNISDIAYSSKTKSFFVKGGNRIYRLGAGG